MVNKVINRKKCTLIWHIDDVMGSHVEQTVLDDIAEKLNNKAKYGQEMPLMIHRGMVHEYLGMTINYSEDGKVKFSMPDYIKGLLDKAPEDMDRAAVTPAANDLFAAWDGTELLNNERAKIFHHLTAKLLYLLKRAHPNILHTTSFLMTQVTKPNIYDWKKLGRCIRYVRSTKDLMLTLEADE